MTMSCPHSAARSQRVKLSNVGALFIGANQHKATDDKSAVVITISLATLPHSPSFRSCCKDANINH